VFDSLWEQVLAVPKSNEQFSATGEVIGVYYTDPDYFIAVDGTQSPAVLDREPAGKVGIEVRMSCDTADLFWRGNLNVPVALMKGKVKINGPSAKAMKLLPALAAGFDIYPRIIEQRS
jgi:putative sterol carrier protein